jgi:P pilus assembly chaperone PapD
MALEMPKVHRKMLRWASIWTLTSVTVAFLATLCVLWLLPYKAFPVLIQTNAIQVAALEAKSSDLTNQIETKQAEFDQLKKAVAEESTDLSLVAPLLRHDPADPNVIWVKLNGKADTETIDKENFWARIH